MALLPSPRWLRAAPLGLLLVCGCRPPGANDSGSTAVRITASAVDSRFTTQTHFLAAAEMQISGEPFAEAMKRDLGGYSRDLLPTDLYADPSPTSDGPWIDLTGFSTGIESYEYSKQPMNFVALESGAGTSLVHGPLHDPDGAGGAPALAALAARVQLFAQGSHAQDRFVFPPGTYPAGNPRSGNTNPDGLGVASANPLGWPGLWPTTHLFRSFDPTVSPQGGFSLACIISSDDDAPDAPPLVTADYECDYSHSHLAQRAAQADFTVGPGADGFSGWKYGLWVLNYLQVLHDPSEAAVSSVAASDLASVGSAANRIVGADDRAAPTLPGTFLGSSDIEGFQAALFIEELDDRAEDWLRHLATVDGVQLSGFDSVAAAEAYDEQAPLRWFPGALTVTETDDDASGFPRPRYAIASADSSLLDLVGVSLAYSEFYALTDTGNPDVGGSQPAMAYFDGSPFPVDDPLTNGQPTLHDRALAMLRVAWVNVDRLHADPATSVLVDDVALGTGTPQRGATVSTPSVAYAILGLRTARRALSSQLTLYSNNTPDTAVATTPLDVFPLHAPGQPTLSFSQRLDQLLRAQSDLLLSHLTDGTGRAYDGWNLATQAPLDDRDLLDAHTAAIRGLFAAYLATGDVAFRERAVAVYQRMESVFYDAGARLYGATPAPVSSVTYTPLRFALLQSALRDVYELVAANPGQEALELQLEERVGRLNKLVLNGWDDRNQNQLVDWPDECVNVQNGLPRGGLQQAERGLTGEIGRLEEPFGAGLPVTPTSDREHDCVPEVDDAQLPAALADSITFQVQRE